jgi:hypothetical protein
MSPNNLVNFGLDNASLAYLEGVAASRGVSVSAYVREVVMAALRVEVPRLSDGTIRHRVAPRIAAQGRGRQGFRKR